MRQEILGVGFDSLTVDEAAGRALALIDGGQGGCVVTPNPEIVYLCREDERLSRAVNSADLVLPDGIGIIYGAKLLHLELRGRVTGMDFSQALMEKLAYRGQSLFLLGAKPGVAREAGEKLKERFSGLEIAGVHDGYLKEDGPVVEEIRESGAKAVFVCLGAPKQELWMERHRGDLPGVLLVGLGGALDVYSGRVKRAPEAFQKLGLEWFYRLIKEPSRFGRMLKLPKFLFLVARSSGKSK